MDRLGAHPTPTQPQLFPSKPRDYVGSKQRPGATIESPPGTANLTSKRHWMLSCLLTLLAACGGSSTVAGPDESPSPPPSEASLEAVSVHPSELTIGVGDTARLKVQGEDENGDTVSISNGDVQWTSSDSSVATVDATGVVSVQSGGTVKIRAEVAPESADDPMRDSARVVAQAEGGSGGTDGTGGSGGGSSGGGGGTVPDNPANPFRAFPGAEGWGAEALTQCNRSQMQVLTVDNLKDSGLGSLRDAISRARSDVLTIITFDVAGYIDVSSRIKIDRGASCLYVAGQTAPGDGITIRAWEGQGFMFRSGPVRDVVIRYLRFRNGTRNPGANTDAQGMLIGTGERVVLDHLSFSWANDQLLSFYKYPYDWGPLRKVSLQRTLFAEPFASSPVCYSIGGDKTGSRDGIPEYYKVDQITFHHNAAVHCSHRAPDLGARATDVINNVVYNWNQAAMHTSRKASADYVANYFRRGPMNRSLTADFGYEFSHPFGTNTPYGDEPNSYRVIGNTNNVDSRAGPQLYLSGNIGPHNTSGAKDNWSMTSKYKNDEREGLPESYYESVSYGDVGKMPISIAGVRLRRETRHPSPPIPVRTDGASRAWSDLIEDEDIGANRRLSCEGGWVNMQDPVDDRVLQEARSGTGRSSVTSLTSQTDVGGFPALDQGVPCADNDGDGMPNEFESRYGLSPDEPNDAQEDPDNDGYTNVEEYLNGTKPR